MDRSSAARSHRLRVALLVSAGSLLAAGRLAAQPTVTRAAVGVVAASSRADGAPRSVDLPPEVPALATVLKWTAVGAVSGAVLGAGVTYAAAGRGCDLWGQCTRAGKAKGGAIVGALAGALVGGVVGLVRAGGPASTPARLRSNEGPQLTRWYENEVSPGWAAYRPRLPNARSAENLATELGR